jgi:hypothetical protein
LQGIRAQLGRAIGTAGNYAFSRVIQFPIPAP